MNLKISRAQAEHASILTEISISAKRHWNYPEAWIQHWLPILTISADYISTHEVWMMLDETKPIAFYSLSQNKDTCELDHLWVLPDYIGKGIGKQLFNHALERCKKLGASVLKIESDPNAQTFYERMGATKVGENHSQLFSEDRVLPIMEINL
ncbi:MAG: GNAT family N-acetyltransferase [Anaerolineales bacterium]|nr:GNAT family N-acetyltransferase [Anaerolineales bacterium]